MGPFFTVMSPLPPIETVLGNTKDGDFEKAHLTGYFNEKETGRRK